MPKPIHIKKIVQMEILGSFNTVRVGVMLKNINLADSTNVIEVFEKTRTPKY
jgi:hypothetical protein